MELHRTNDTTTSLATRHRPASFATVIGQRHVVEVLRRAVQRNTVPQQLLFSGGSGLGKTTIARIVAAAMLCDTPLERRDRGDACGTCAACRAVIAGTHPDLIELDAASHGGKDEIRDIAARCQLLPLTGPVKIYIVDEAHGLSNPGGQAFLKLLEEPPAHVRFMLCTTDPQRMLKTTRGRCVEFELLPPTRRELLDNLRRICDDEHWPVADDILDAVIDAADPDLGVRGTVTTLAKIADLVADGNTMGDEATASLLGAPSPASMRRLLAAIDAGDRHRALLALGDARRASPDTVIHTALTRWAEKRLAAALDETGADADRSLPVALWRLELLVDRPAAGGRLDLTIAKLTVPELDDAGAHVVADTARNLIGQLADATRTAATTLGATGATGAPVPVPVPVPANPAGAPAAGPVTPTPEPDVARLLAAASPPSPELRAILPRCQVTITDAEVAVVVPDELVAAATPLVPALRSAAGRLGLPLKLRKASAATSGR